MACRDCKRNEAHLREAWEKNLQLKEELERLQEFRSRVIEALGPLPPGADDEGIVELVGRFADATRTHSGPSFSLPREGP